MNVISRGIRNAFRNSVRTASIVVILGLSIGLCLTMVLARQAVQQKITQVKSSVGNTITIQSAGLNGFSGGGNPLTDAQLTKVAALSHVTSVASTLSDRLDSSDTNLTSATNLGSLGQRFEQFSGGGNISGGNITTGTFTPSISLIGTNDPTSLSQAAGGGGTVKLTSGSSFNGNGDQDVAIVGSALASKNSLSVGSTFTAYGTTITVTGIYTTGTTFGDGIIVMPLTTVQTLSSQSNDITSAIVTVDSVSNLNSTTTAIKNTLGSSADVTSSETQANSEITPLNSVKNISLFSLIGAAAAGAVIILLVMVMIVRERRREIGVLKAIGGSNVSIIFQFVVEAITLTVLGAVIGLMIGVIGGTPVTKLLVNNSGNNTATPARSGGFAFTQGSNVSSVPSGVVQRPTGGFGGRLRSNSVVNSFSDIHADIGWGLLLYGFGATIVIAAIGSTLAAGLIAKIKPAEVLRTE